MSTCGGPSCEDRRTIWMGCSSCDTTLYYRCGGRVDIVCTVRVVGGCGLLPPARASVNKMLPHRLIVTSGVHTQQVRGARSNECCPIALPVWTLCQTGHVIERRYKAQQARMRQRALSTAVATQGLRHGLIRYVCHNLIRPARTEIGHVSHIAMASAFCRSSEARS